MLQERTCRNTDSLLWQWQGSHLVSQEGRAVAVDKDMEGAKLSAVSLAAADTKQMWMMDEGILKMITTDFYEGERAKFISWSESWGRGGTGEEF